MIEQQWKETCPACSGMKIQKNNEGINISCPMCGGTGFIWRSNYDDVPPGQPMCNT